MSYTTKEECEGNGWIWNEKKQTCKRPVISTLTMKLSRGSECGGSSKRRKVPKPQKQLSDGVRDAILKASEPKGTFRKPG